jgi:hypothetical protein
MMWNVVRVRFGRVRVMEVFTLNPKGEWVRRLKLEEVLEIRAFAVNYLSDYFI